MTVLEPIRSTGWPNLPDEFVHPSVYSMSSPSAQEILESRGLASMPGPSRYRAAGAMVEMAGYGATWAEFANRLELP